MNPAIDPPLRLLAAFDQLYPSQLPQVLVQAPGREMWAAVHVTNGDAYTVHAVDLGAHTTFTYQSAKIKQTLRRRPLPAWARYAAGVSVLLDDLAMPGIEAVVCGNEPPGPRHDFALGLLFAALWHEVNHRPAEPSRLFDIAEQVRRAYIEA